MSFSTKYHEQRKDEPEYRLTRVRPGKLTDKHPPRVLGNGKYSVWMEYWRTFVPIEFATWTGGSKEKFLDGNCGKGAFKRENAPYAPENIEARNRDGRTQNRSA